MPQQLYGILQACGLLGIGRSTFYDLVATGQIRTVHIGARHLVSASELDRYVDGLRVDESPGAA